MAKQGIGTEVRALLKVGQSNRAIVAQLGVSSATVSYHAKKLGMDKTARPTYNWALIQAHYDDGASIRECCEVFGCAKDTFYAAAHDGRMKVAIRSNEYIGAEEYGLMKSGAPGGGVRSKLKTKIIRDKLIEFKCAICGIAAWNGKPLSLNLDHINGNSRDHRIENLRFVCPNCDSQQDTFAYRNVGRWKFSQ